jgi:hypothetical protein
MNTNEWDTAMTGFFRAMGCPCGSRLKKWMVIGCLGALGLGAACADVISGTGAPSATTLGRPTATYIRVESSGSGHGLIVPYFTTQNEAITMLNVSNTDRANGKLVKMRIRGAANGDVLLSMTLLLAPGDMWAAALRRAESGHAALVAHPNDKTCTLPALPKGSGERLKTNRLAVNYSADQLANQTREGLVEYIVMADIPAAAVYGTTRQANSALFQAIKHVNGVAPCGDALDRLEENFTSESAAAELGLAAPTGGLAGRWIIMNVPRSLTFSGPMHAVRALEPGGASGRANFVQFPQTDSFYPVAQVDGVTADPLLRTQAYPAKASNGDTPLGATTTPAVRALHLDFPDFSTPYSVAPGDGAALGQALQFTRAMAAKRAGNEFLTNHVVQFKTDWVLSMPARRFSVAVDQTTARSRLLYSMVPSTGLQYFHDANTFVPAQDTNQSCTHGGEFEWRDREAKGREPGAVIIGPTLPLRFRVCGMVGAQNFNQDTTTYRSPTPLESATAPASFLVYESNYTSDLVARADDGWALLKFDVTSHLGLPIIAHAFSSAINPVVRPGVSGNYGMNSEHWYAR